MYLTRVLGNDNYVNPKELDHIGNGRGLASVVSCSMNNIQVIAFTKFNTEYMRQFFGGIVFILITMGVIM
jgi:hypothetical protein